MSQISLKSISGITSITTPAGVDNVFSIHKNNTSEIFRIDQSGNQNISGIVTATTFAGSGASLTNLNASNIASGTVPTARLGSGTASSSTFLRGDSTFQTVNTDLVSDTSPQLGADLDTNGFGILVDDNKVVNFGNNNDLMIYHSGTHSYIKNKTNNLYIMSTNTEYGIEVHGDGKVRLNFDNSPKIETTNTGAVVTGILTATSFSGSGEGLTRTTQLSHRNIIINGGFNINQRSSAITVNAGSNFYGIDRWYGRGESSASVFTVTQTEHGSLHSLASKYSAKVAVTNATTSAAGDVYKIAQRIEGVNCLGLALGTAGAKSFTLSFLVRTSVTGTHGGSFMNSAQNRSYPFTYSVPDAGWQAITITIPGDTSGTWLRTTGIGLELNFDLGSGSGKRASAGSWYAGRAEGATGAVQVTETSSAYWEVSNVQIEVGSVATPFEHRSFSEEFQQCMRYYEKSFPYDTAPANNASSGSISLNGSFFTDSHNNSNRGVVRFKVEKRASPSLTIYGNSQGRWYSPSTGFHANNNTANGPDATGFYPRQQASGSVIRMQGHYAVDAEL